jgi:hypothetical protein
MGPAKSMKFPVIFAVLREFVHALVQTLWARSPPFNLIAMQVPPCPPAAVAGAAELVCGKTQFSRPPLRIPRNWHEEDENRLKRQKSQIHCYSNNREFHAGD